LLVYGDLETGGMVPGVLADMFAQTIPGAVATRIPNGTHGLHRDSKSEFLEIVLPFLRHHSVTASRLV
jgi:pimeloyl-ACP methyl ester carboxylesterase